jgi:hypothetical protein
MKRRGLDVNVYVSICDVNLGSDTGHAARDVAKFRKPLLNSSANFTNCQSLSYPNV